MRKKKHRSHVINMTPTFLRKDFYLVGSVSVLVVKLVANSRPHVVLALDVHHI